MGFPVVPRMGYRCLFSWLHGFRAGKAGACSACWRCFPGRRYPGIMTMTPEHVDLHRMVDRLDPDQVRALRAVAQQLLRPAVEHFDSGRLPASEQESLLADEPVRDFSFIGLFNGAPDLAERSEEILREEFTKRADADR